MTDFTFNILDAIFGIIAPSNYPNAANIIRERYKEQRETFKKTTPAKEEISNEMVWQAKRMSNGNPLIQQEFISRAIKTMRLINFAIYYMTDKDAKLIVLDDDQRAFVNSIAILANFGKIYPEDGEIDLSEIDARNLGVTYPGRFLLILDEVNAKIDSEDFNTKKVERMMELGIINSITSSEPKVLPPGYSSPISFSDPGIFYQPSHPQGAGVSDEEYNKMIDAFGGALAGRVFTYNYEPDGNYYLTIYRTDCSAMDKYLIDNGRILGGDRISILAKFIRPNGNQDQIFVDVKNHPEIASKILDAAFIPLERADVEQVVMDGFNCSRIYKYIDFSNTNFMNYLTPLAKYNLERSLLGVLGVLDKFDPLVRLRFTHYSSPNNFTLVSDNQVISTLPDTNSKVLDGLQIRLIDNSITKTYGGNIGRYNMR